MKLLSLKASNVFSLGDIELNLNNRGLVLVNGHSVDEGGANGAGKSSLANKSILWCLFGQTAGGLRADEIVNRHTAPPCFVEISFESSDGKTYTIKRSRKPSSLELHCGAERLTQRNEKDTQEIINRALGRNYETFLYSDFFGQGRNENFLSISPKDQKAILERILPIAQLSKWSDTAASHKSSVVSSIQETEKKLAFLRGGVEKLQDQLNSNFHLSSRWDKEHLVKIADRTVKIESYQKEHEATLSQIKELEDRIASIEVPPDISTQLSKAFQAMTSLREQHGKANDSAASWLSERVRYFALVNQEDESKCGTCNQSLPPAAIETQKTNKIIWKDKLISAEITLEQATNAVSYLKEEYQKATGEYNRLKDAVQDGDARMSLRSSSEVSLQIKKKLINSDILNQWTTELEMLKRETNPFVDVLKRAEIDLQTEKEVLQNKESSLAIILLERDRLAFWQDAFGKDLKIWLLDRVCPFLTEKVSNHLEGLGNSQIKVKFGTTKQLKSGEARDEFCVDICCDSGGSGYDSLSGGEQQIVSFAVGLALADLAESQAVGISRILILDEPFMSLDQRNSENVLFYLQEMTKRRETILLISNEDNLKSLIPNVLHIIKENGISRLQ
jgi:DNA repair exonuclease SbcCD ATPase subunit